MHDEPIVHETELARGEHFAIGTQAEVDLGVEALRTAKMGRRKRGSGGDHERLRERGQKAGQVRILFQRLRLPDDLSLDVGQPLGGILIFSRLKLFVS